MSENGGKTDSRPINVVTGRRVGPLPQPGYYPDYSTLSQQDFWDAATRKAILDRVQNVPAIRFFTPHEARLMEVVCEHVLPQADRDEAHRIPIVPFIDSRLYEGRHDGYRYTDMPPDDEAFRLGLQAIEQIAQHLYGKHFLEIQPLEQDQILQSIHHGKPPAGEEIWKRVPAHRFWMMLVQDCAEVYYAHPWAWDEIGYGGPAYPRAYMRLENGQPEPWEKNEQRYEWRAPENSVSDIYEPVAGSIEHYGVPGQGGTH